MVFSSTIFLFAFLPLTLGGYYLIRQELRNIFLLVMSLFFYAWGEPRFVLVMMASIFANYFMGLLFDQTRNSPLVVRRLILVVATGLNLSLLFYYKYFDFFITNVNSLFNSRFALRNIVLPIGISFFTFQGMSYIFDLYLGKVKVQKNLIHIALYIALFPQLIAGPIVRYIDVNEQIEGRTHTLEKFTVGVERFIVGLAKKIIISNAFALVADTAFNMPATGRSVLMAWLGAIAYAIQIYFDFSGYSDMAIGLGKMFGFDFLENFNYPYIATSITDFWRRWHISLSSWFRDYIYIPLGGNRRGNTYFNLLVVFFVTGLWHGASWNFIVWGLWHGLFLIAEKLLKAHPLGFRLLKPFRWLYTMLVVLVGWVLFRAPDLTSAITYLKDLVGANGNQIYDTFSLFLCQDNLILFLLAILFAGALCVKLNQLCDEYVVLNQARRIFRPIGYILLFVVSISFTVISTYNPFIYFNF